MNVKIITIVSKYVIVADGYAFDSQNVINGVGCCPRGICLSGSFLFESGIPKNYLAESIF
jgi:hypothetical protein